MTKPVTKQLTTLRDYLRWAVSRMTQEQVYFGHGTDNAWDEALNLILPLLGVPEHAARELLDATLLISERELLLAAVDRRVIERVPVPYITGQAWFAGMPFHVDERVLIPRSPIAELIGNGFEPWLPGLVTSILDLCTGSGCIGIACARHFEDATVDLGDVSADALVVAERNIQRYQLRDRVNIVESDLFAALVGRRYDLIVSNPPYVDQRDMDALPLEYRHEPVMALASGADGLDITSRILREAADYLTDWGVLVVEVGNSWQALEEAFPNVPFTWLEFEHGGHGVLVMTRELLETYREELLSAGTLAE